MFKHLFLGLGALLLLMAMMVMPVQAATMNGLPPDASVIVTRGNLEWVWASPCAGEEPSCDNEGDPTNPTLLPDGDLADRLPAFNFNLPNDAQWLASFQDHAALYGAFAPGGNLEPVICGASYFSQDFDNCNVNDLRDGNVWHSPFALNENARINAFSETFLVRERAGDPVIPTPLPPSALLFGAGLLGLGLAAWRWKRIA
jgi:hypothetical protein